MVYQRMLKNTDGLSMNVKKHTLRLPFLYVTAYKQPTLGLHIAKQLSGLNPFSLSTSNNKKY